MATFNDTSLDRLKTVHPDLQTLFLEVIKHRDCSVTAGFRTAKEQSDLYAQGRTEPGNIVTNADGVDRKSYHQSGQAVDVVPYPEMWDEQALRDFGHFVKGIAVMLKRYGAIDNDIEWGGDWKFLDRPHWQL